MRGLIVGLAIYMTVGLGAEARSIGGFLDGKKLLEFCVEENNKCSGYLMGFVDTMALTDIMLNAFGKILGPDVKRPVTLVCFPASLSFESEKLRSVWIKWAEKHPEHLHRMASGLALIAFEAEWPCEE